MITFLTLRDPFAEKFNFDRFTDFHAYCVILPEHCVILSFFGCLWFIDPFGLIPSKRSLYLWPEIFYNVLKSDQAKTCPGAVLFWVRLDHVTSQITSVLVI